MTDDIVTRLRYIYSQRDIGVSVNPDTFTEAADEIERLRDALAMACGLISTMPQYEHEDVENIIEMFWQEAAHDG